MGYQCLDCGNYETFAANQNYTETGSERVFFDGEGDISDYGDRDSIDSETDGFEDIECCDCGSYSINDEAEEVDFEENKLKIEKEKENEKKVKNWKKEFSK